jgi:hypothetical protein
MRVPGLLTVACIADPWSLKWIHPTRPWMGRGIAVMTVGHPANELLEALLRWSGSQAAGPVGYGSPVGRGDEGRVIKISIDSSLPGRARTHTPGSTHGRGAA